LVTTRCFRQTSGNGTDERRRESLKLRQLTEASCGRRGCPEPPQRDQDRAQWRARTLQHLEAR